MAQESQWSVFDSEGCAPLGQHKEHREPWPSLLSVHCFALVQVRSYGGVLVEEDFSNYSVTVEDPVHTIYRGTPSPIAMQLQGKVLFTSQGAATALNKS